MAQVQNIRSTTKNGGGGSGGASGGGSGGGETGGGGGAAPQLFQIQLQGSNYSRDQVRGLIEQINGAIADGAVLKVMP
jgi:hypothetical protein